MLEVCCLPGSDLQFCESVARSPCPACGLPRPAPGRCIGASSSSLLPRSRSDDRGWQCRSQHLQETGASVKFRIRLYCTGRHVLQSQHTVLMVTAGICAHLAPSLWSVDPWVLLHTHRCSWFGKTCRSHTPPAAPAAPAHVLEPAPDTAENKERIEK